MPEHYYVYGAPYASHYVYYPPYTPPSTLTLPARTDDRVGSYKKADEQADTVKELPKTRDERTRTPYETIDYFDRDNGRSYKRYFKVEDGKLLEWQAASQGRPERWVAASTLGVDRYFYADGYLYSEDGKRLGRFGINSDASKELKDKVFLHTYGTFERPEGGFVDYWGATLRMGNRTAIVQMGPPPGLVAVYRDSTKDVIVDHPNGRWFRGINGDKAYERIWVKPEEAAKYTKPSYAGVDVSKLTPAEDGYRYTSDGKIRFKSVGTGYTAEVRVHYTTNWRDMSGRLCTARVAWTEDPDIVVKRTGPEPGTGVRGVVAKKDGKGPLIDAPADTGGPKKEEKGAGGVVQLPMPREAPQPKAEEKKVEPVRPVVAKQPDPAPVVQKKTNDDPPERVVSGGTKKKRDDDVPEPRPVVKLPDPPPEEVTKVQKPLIPPPPVQDMKLPPPAVVRPLQQGDTLVMFDVLQSAMLLRDLTIDLKEAALIPLNPMDTPLAGGPYARFAMAPCFLQQGGLDRIAPSMAFEKRARDVMMKLETDYQRGGAPPLDPVVLAALKDMSEKTQRHHRDVLKEEQPGVLDNVVFQKSADQITASRQWLEERLVKLVKEHPLGAESCLQALRDEADRRFGANPLALQRYHAEIDRIEAMVTGRPVPVMPAMPAPGNPGLMPPQGMQPPFVPGQGMPGPFVPGQGMPQGMPGQNGVLPMMPPGWLPVPRPHEPGELPDPLPGLPGQPGVVPRPQQRKPQLIA